MKNSDLRKLTDEELVKRISDTKKELFELRLKQATGSLDKPAKIHELRKEVARMLTILKERELSKEEDK